MMKLNYTNKRTITTADLYDACNPPLIFEVRTRPPKGWALIDLEFTKGDYGNVELAKQIIAGIFLTVCDGSEDGEVYPIQTVEQVEGMQQAIERGNPGDGEQFLLAIAFAFSRDYYRYIGDHLGNSLKPLPQLNGSGQSKKVVKVS